MTGLGRVVTVSTVLTLVAACQEKLPTGPSDLWEGVVVYEHANFQGTSAHLTQSVSVPNLQLTQGTCDHDGLNDCATSIRVSRSGMASTYSSNRSRSIR